MITREDIRRECHPASFSKGLELYENKKVMNLESARSIDMNGWPCIEICGGVLDDDGEVYGTEIYLDEERQGIIGSGCDCQDFETDAGLCRHCVALILTYTEGERRKRHDLEAAVREERDGSALDMLMESMGVSKGTKALVPADQKSQWKTTYGLKELLGNYSLREQSAYLPAAFREEVVLEAHVKIYRDTCSVEFKIGREKMYVVKSVSALAAAVLNRELVRYGKSLEFVHQLQAFTPEAREMLRFIFRVVGDGPYYFYNQNGRYYGYGSDREITVFSSVMDEFMEALPQNGFYLKVDGRQEQYVTIARAMPPMPAVLEGGEGGAVLKVPILRYFSGTKNTWFFEGDKVYQVSREDLDRVWDFLDVAGKSRGKCIIADQDLSLFCQELLPMLQENFQLTMKDFLPEKYLPPEAEFEIYLDAPQRDMVTCKLVAVYGKVKYNLFVPEESMEQNPRPGDIKRELQVKGRVRAYFHAYDEREKVMAMQGEEAIYEFLCRGLDSLRELGEVYVSDKLKAMRVLPSPRVSVGIRLSGNLLEVSLDSQGLPMEELAVILSKYDRKKKYYRLKNGDFINLDEDGIRVLSELREGMQVSEKSLRGGSFTVPRYRALYLDTRLREEQALPVAKDRDFKALIRNMRTVEDNDYEIPASLQGTLREYQKRGFLWMKALCANGFGGILADDMGLGKTLQTIAFLLSEHEGCREEENRRTLIVAPASLVYNWKSEFERFAPTLQVEIVAGTGGQRKKQITGSSCKSILITSYELLRRDVEIYEGVSFFAQIIDEAQFIKNHGTQAAKVVKKVDAGFRLALTGTPVENQLSELWSIFDYLMPGFLYSYPRFKELLEIPIVRNQQEEALKRLQKMVGPFILRRMKQDVLKDLPDKIEKNMFAHLEGEQKELYQAHVQRLQLQLAKQTPEQFAGSRLKILAELTRLRQVCCHPGLIYEGYGKTSAKLELCIQLIKNAVDGGHKILLFSQFTSMLDILIGRIEEEEISYFLLTGGTPKEKRTQMVETFNRDDTSIFCISLKAGGTGLNLTGADMVIHYDPWWNIAVENQASDRAHRIGQKKVVTVYKLIAKDTIEEKIIQLQEMKRELAGYILSAESMKQATFSRDELLELLQSR